MHVHVDALAGAAGIAMQQGGEQAHDGEVAGGLVALVPAPGDRRQGVVVVAATPGGTAAGQQREVRGLFVCARAVAAEGRHRHVDQARPIRPQGVVAEAVGGQRARPFRLQQGVGAVQQTQEQVAPGRPGPIERDRALVEVVVPEVQAALGMGIVVQEGGQVAGGGAARRLDADDVGAHVRQQLAGERARLGLQLDDAEVREGAADRPVGGGGRHITPAARS